MKKTLLILLLSISAFAFSQNYQGYVPFPTDDAYWLESNIASSQCIKNEYRLNGDTLINGLLYTEIEKTEIDQSSSIGCVPPWNAQISKSTFGYIRNDSANKKVWIRYPNANVDSLFYDFDINVGDTIFNNFYDTVVVSSVDTVYMGNRYRKKYFFVKNNFCIQNYGFDYMIEGVGRNTGFAFRDYCLLAGLNTSLDCMGDSSGGVYPDTNTCRLITNLTEKEQKTKNNIQLYPNPTTGLINLSFEKALQSIEIYNLQGQKVQEVTPQKRSWELPEQSGLYLIRIQDEEGNVYTEKIIKN
jgi:hypothetical protein